MKKNNAVLNVSCPFPGCALAIEHDGDHIPKLRRVQTFHGTIAAGAVHPGYCEIVEGCFDEVVALYATATGKAFGVCLKHENQILKSGATALLKGWCA